MNHPIDQIEPYIAGGLGADEQAAFELHVAQCPACAVALHEAQAADAAMNDLFAAVRPAVGFEDRVIASLKARPSLPVPRRIHPMVRRTAIALAASLMLGVSGLVGYLAEHGGASRGQEAQAKRRSLSILIDRSGSTATSTPAAQRGAIFDNWTGSNGGGITVPDHKGAATTAPGASKDPKLQNQARGNSTYAVQGPWAFDNLDSYLLPTDDGRARPEGVFPSSIGLAEQTWAARRDQVSSGDGDRSSRAYFLSRNPTNTKTDPLEADTNGTFALGDRNGPPVGSGLRLRVGDKVLSDPLYFTTRGYRQDNFDLTSQLVGGLQSQKPQDGSPVAWNDYAYTAGALNLVNGSFRGGFGSLGGRFQDNSSNHWGTATEASALPNTGLSVTSGPTTTVPGSIGKTANALTVAVDPDAGKPNGQPLRAGPANPKPNVAVALADNPPTTAKDPQPAKPVVPPAVDVVVKPKIIRTGDMDFEVESFDTAVATITKVVAEEAGYVSTTNSEKLPNGKVKGSVILRVAPEHLDTLVLKLRGIGDLRTQHITAQDITKQYTDMQSRLRAAQVMQERLLDMIKNGKGTVKDLLEAEKQLGIVRENIEQMEGEIRFYDHQVSLSTLTLTLFERDIRTPAVATETDAVTMAVETETVTDADVKAKDAISQAKGRIVTASLTQDNSGKLMSTIVAQVPPDAADACLGRLKQIDGHVARFDRQRNQTTSNGSSPVDSKMADPIKLKREDVSINLTIYNLANYDARRWTTVTLVVPNVEETDRLLKEQVRLAGGRMLESQINHPRPDQTAGTLKFDVPMAKADALLLALRGLGEALQVNTTENANTQNATESKRGFVILFGTLSAFPPRETQTIELASLNVKSAFEDLHKLLETSQARILASHLDERDRAGNVGTLDFEVVRASVPTLEQAMNKDGQVVTRLAEHKTDAENMVDAKVRFTLTIGNSEQLPARQSTDLGIEVPDSQAAMNALQAAALSSGGRQVDTPQLTQSDTGQTTATLALDVPLDQLPALIARTEAAGTRKSLKTSIDAHAPEGKLARARLTVTFTTPAAVTGTDDSMSTGISHGLSTSMRWARNVLVPIIVGLCIVVPIALVMWISWKGVRLARRHFGAVAAKP